MKPSRALKKTAHTRQSTRSGSAFRLPRNREVISAKTEATRTRIAIRGVDCSRRDADRFCRLAVDPPIVPECRSRQTRIPRAVYDRSREYGDLYDHRLRLWLCSGVDSRIDATVVGRSVPMDGDTLC